MDVEKQQHQSNGQNIHVGSKVTINQANSCFGPRIIWCNDEAECLHDAEPDQVLKYLLSFLLEQPDHDHLQAQNARRVILDSTNEDILKAVKRVQLFLGTFKGMDGNPDTDGNFYNNLLLHRKYYFEKCVQLLDKMLEDKCSVTEIYSNRLDMIAPVVQYLCEFIPLDKTATEDHRGSSMQHRTFATLWNQLMHIIGGDAYDVM